MKRDDTPELEIRGVVHDVNQLLMAISGRAQFLRTCRAPEELANDLESIETAAHDASAMLDRLLPDQPARDAGSTADLRGCVATAAGVIRPPGNDGWSPAGTQPGPGVWILANEVPSGLVADLPPVLVREVLNNLLLNSLEVLPGGGRLTVEAVAAGARLRLWVSDDGPGIDPDLAPRIFEPGASTSGETGRGVGLAACRRILASRRADLDLAESRFGGATFMLDLPAAMAAGAAPGAAPSPDVSGIRVLVVDDEPAVREMLADVLDAWGCQSVLVADAASAETACELGEVDVVLADRNLPDRSGEDLVALLRGTCPSGCVLMTGLDRADEIDEDGDGVADATLLKPLDLDDLQRLLAEMAALAGRRRREGTDTEEIT